MKIFRTLVINNVVISAVTESLNFWRLDILSKRSEVAAASPESVVVDWMLLVVAQKDNKRLAKGFSFSRTGSDFLKELEENLSELARPSRRTLP